MMTYLKHVGNFKHSDLKTKKFEEIQALYEKIKRSDEDFISIGSAEDKRLIKKMNEKGIDSSKNEMVDKAKHLEEINQNVVIRSNGQKRYFSTLMRVLSIFDRDDLNVVYQLIEYKSSWKLHGFSGTYFNDWEAIRSLNARREKKLTIPEQTTTGKGTSNPFMRSIQQGTHRIASLESKLASQDIHSCQKEYHELRTSYNALKVKFDALNRKKWNINVSKSSKPKESVLEKVHTEMLSMQNKNDSASIINKNRRFSNEAKTNFQNVSSNDNHKWKSSSSTRFKTPHETPSFKNQWKSKRNFKSPLILRELFSNETPVSSLRWNSTSLHRIDTTLK
ncbi:hypothetical protein Tco_0231266 [Tanacetum coccineum]